jgi:hypothetical protein
MVNQTWLLSLRAVPTAVLALDVHRAGIPGQPGANRVDIWAKCPCLIFFVISAAIVIAEIIADSFRVKLVRLSPGIVIHFRIIVAKFILLMVGDIEGGNYVNILCNCISKSGLNSLTLTG